MNDISKVEVIIPTWAKDIEDQNFICFIAFLYRINIHYGYDTYGMVKSDINTILATKIEVEKYIFSNWPIAKNWLTIQNTAYSMVNITLKEQFREIKAGINATSRYELTDQRALLIWVYLLGAFNRNLLTDKPFPYNTKYHMFESEII